MHMEYLYILILLVLILLGLYFFKQNTAIYGTPQEKKENIENEYINEIKAALKKADTQDEKVKIKLHYIKKFNNELSRNIFFTAQEAKELLSRLSKL